MSLIDHAKAEFVAAGWMNEAGTFECDMQAAICGDVLELLKVFAKQEHSGSSAPYAVSLFEKLARYQQVAPITGEDWEWAEVADGEWQNKRASNVFKSANRFGGKPYCIDAVIFWEWVTLEDGERYKSQFTGRESHQPVTLPGIPKTTYCHTRLRWFWRLKQKLAGG